MTWAEWKEEVERQLAEMKVPANASIAWIDTDGGKPEVRFRTYVLQDGTREITIS